MVNEQRPPMSQVKPPDQEAMASSSRAPGSRDRQSQIPSGHDVAWPGQGHDDDDDDDAERGRPLLRNVSRLREREETSTMSVQPIEAERPEKITGNERTAVYHDQMITSLANTQTEMIAKFNDIGQNQVELSTQMANLAQALRDRSRQSSHHSRQATPENRQPRGSPLAERLDNPISDYDIVRPNRRQQPRSSLGSPIRLHSWERRRPDDEQPENHRKVSFAASLGPTESSRRPSRLSDYNDNPERYYRENPQPAPNRRTSLLTSVLENSAHQAAGHNQPRPPRRSLLSDPPQDPQRRDSFVNQSHEQYSRGNRHVTPDPNSFDPDSFTPGQRSQGGSTALTAGSHISFAPTNGKMQLSQRQIGQFIPDYPDEDDVGQIDGKQFTIYTDVYSFMGRLESFLEDPATEEQITREFVILWPALLGGQAIRWWETVLTSSARAEIRQKGLLCMCHELQRRFAMQPSEATKKFTSARLQLRDLVRDSTALETFIQRGIRYARAMRVLSPDNSNWFGVVTQIWSQFHLEIQKWIRAPQPAEGLDAYMMYIAENLPQILAVAKKSYPQIEARKFGETSYGYDDSKRYKKYSKYQDDSSDDNDYGRKKSFRTSRSDGYNKRSFNKRDDRRDNRRDNRRDDRRDDRRDGGRDGRGGNQRYNDRKPWNKDGKNDKKDWKKKSDKAYVVDDDKNKSSSESSSVHDSDSSDESNLSDS